MKKILSLIFLLAFACGVQAQTIYYVNIGSGNDASSGTSWSNAFQNLTKALAAANASSASEVQIWVADGAYTPTAGISALPSDHRDTSFTFYRGSGIGRALKVYGGFAGTESSIAARDTTHTSYLDGVIGSVSTFHVGVIAGISPAADSIVIDGFTFNNGIASGGGTKIFNGIATNQSAGGGLLIQNDSSTKLAIRKCVFAFNTATGKDYTGTGYLGGDGFGGGLYIRNSSCLLEQCHINNNYASGGNGGGGSLSFYGTGGTGLGGGIYNDNSLLVAAKCNFDNNVAVGGNGLYVTMAYGYAGSSKGGGLYFINTAVAKILNCSFSSNASLIGWGDAGFAGSSYGGAVCNLNSTVLYKNCSYTGNRSTDSSGYTQGQNYGGAVANLSFSGRFDSCTFSSNSALAYNNPYILNRSFGGTIYNYASPDTFTHCDIGYSKSSLGSSVCNEQTISVFDYCNIHHGTNWDSYFSYYYGRGAAVYNRGHSDIIISNSSINSNWGGIENDTSTITLTNDSVAFNSSAYGWAYYPDIFGLRSCGATANVTNCKICGNGLGNGINNIATSLTVKSSLFSYNGSGIYSQGGNPNIDSCRFDNNSGDRGGGIYCYDSTATIRHCVFSNNRAYYTGGAICLGSGSNNFKSDGNTFINNSAQSGGAISVEICTTCTDSLLNNIFIGNKSTSATSGGGAILVNASRNYIYNNTFLYDTAIGGGGAIRLESTGGLVKVANNIFYNCRGAGSTIDTSIAGTGTYLFANNIHNGTNPQFRNVANPAGADGIWGTNDDGIQLQSCSPAVNTGNNAYVVSGELLDVTGNTRLSEGIVDIGAYEGNNIGVITGPSYICRGTTTTYTDTTAGGSWTSSNPAIASVSSTGSVHAVNVGSVIISYSAGSSCGGSLVATRTITVERPAAIIVGADTICAGSTSVFSDTVTGGTWTSSNTTIATISASGILAALQPGNDTVRYSITNSCGTYNLVKPVLVQRRASIITGGAGTICRSVTTVFSDSTAGGMWSTSNTSVATINSVTGSFSMLREGYDSVIYTVSNICGISTAVRWIGVDVPASGIVTPDSLCITSYYVTPFDSASGGTWALSNHSVLNFYTTSTGVYYPVTTGIDTLSYTVTNACGTHTVSKQITCVDFYHGTITGPDSVCVGHSILLRDTVATTGAWSTADVTIATVTSGGNVVGLSGGTAIITYNVSNACGANYSWHTIFVNTLPTPTVTGSSSSVCIGGGLALTGSPSGGAWSAINTNASVDIYGVVNGLILGIDTIKYAAANTCGTSIFAYLVTIVDVPTPSSVSGPNTVCEYKTITLVPVTSGGTWASTTGSATVSSAGVVTGFNAGADIIVYTISNACGGAPFGYPITVFSKSYCDSAASVTGVNSPQTTMIVYPNPTTDKLTIDLKSEVTENVIITITNVVGEKVKEWNITSNKTTDKQLNLSSGVYILTANGSNYKFVTRVVVE